MAESARLQEDPAAVQVPLSVTYRTTEDDFVEHLLEQSRHTRMFEQSKFGMRKATMWAAVGSLLTAGVFIHTLLADASRKPFSNIGAGVFVLISGFFLYSCIKVLVRQRAKFEKNLAQATRMSLKLGNHPNITKLTTVRLTDAGVEASSVLGVSFSPWALGVAGVIESERLVILRLASSAAYVIPREAFANRLAEEAFVEFARARQEAAAARAVYADDRCCKKCKYDLRGVLTNVCPECGAWDTPEIDDVQAGG